MWCQELDSLNHKADFFVSTRRQASGRRLETLRRAKRLLKHFAAVITLLSKMIKMRKSFLVSFK